MSDRDLRRQIDRCIGRALFDKEYAHVLLSDPTTVLDGSNCMAQDYLSLQSIEAGSLIDFAEQAQALFWLRFPPPRRPRSQVAQPSGLRIARSLSAAN